MKNFLKNLIALFLGCVLALALIEIVLKIYNPIETRIRGNKIILPINKNYRIENHRLDKLDRVIIHSKNSLGFRGTEPPEEFNKYLTIICIGGSTTECKYLSDNKTWIDVLSKNLTTAFENLWINNAGLDGHSTFGHIILMENYLSLIKPKIALFLFGANDYWGRNDLGSFELQHIRGKIVLSSIEGFIKSLSSYSETASLLLNFYRHYRAKTIGLSHGEVDLKKIEYLELSERTRTVAIQQTEKYIKYYKARLYRIIQIAKDNGIKPVFITQPALFGYEIDDLTGVDLAKIRVGDLNGGIHWDALQIYNEATKQIGRNENILVIDLAKELSKNSRYFYDFFHFTNEGAEKVGNIVYKHLSSYLKTNYSDYAYK
jgi:lysophospholipase L1-like esterase